MSKVQRRRTVSLNREVFDRMKAEAEKRGIPQTTLVEEALLSLWSGRAVSPGKPKQGKDLTPSFVVNLDLVLRAATEEESAEKANSLAAFLVRQQEIDEFIVLSTDPV